MSYQYLVTVSHLNKAATGRAILDILFIIVEAAQMKDKSFSINNQSNILH